MGTLPKSSFWTRSKRNESVKNYIVFPDLHGQYTVSKEAIEAIKPYLESDVSYTVVFLGDYLDRGERGNYEGVDYEDCGSLKTFLLLLEFKQYCEEKKIETIFLRGNHEDIFESFFRFKIVSMLGYPFFVPTAEVFTKTGFHEQMLSFIDSMPFYYYDEEQQIFFVHAGVDPYVKDPTENEAHTMLWTRHEFIESEITLPYKVIFGHTPLKEVLIKKDKIGLDGGVFYDRPGFGKLNVLFIEEDVYSYRQFQNTYLKGADATS